MKKNGKKAIPWGCILLIIFAAFTVSLRFVDVRPIGPQGSCVGYGAVNGAVAKLFPMNEMLYIITDFAGRVSYLIAIGFAVMGLVQWIRRKNILKVDGSILVMGGAYLLAFGVYILFEYLVINCRPVLIEGALEASYPSSTTMRCLCVLPIAAIELWGRIRRAALRRTTAAVLLTFMVLTVAGRLISGVHWLTDIIGGCLFSGALVLLYFGGTRMLLGNGNE